MRSEILSLLMLARRNAESHIEMSFHVCLFQQLSADDLLLLAEWLAVFCIGFKYDIAKSMYQRLMLSYETDYLLQVDAKTAYGPTRPEPVPQCPFFNVNGVLERRSFVRVR